jgi:hypothetical protein
MNEVDHYSNYKQYDPTANFSLTEFSKAFPSPTPPGLNAEEVIDDLI